MPPGGSLAHWPHRFLARGEFLPEYRLGHRRRAGPSATRRGPVWQERSAGGGLHIHRDSDSNQAARAGVTRPGVQRRGPPSGALVGGPPPLLREQGPAAPGGATPSAGALLAEAFCVAYQRSSRATNTPCVLQIFNSIH